METKKLNELLDLFNTQADLVKNRLTDLLVTVSDGRIPDTEMLKSFNTDMDTLVSEYDLLKNEAQSVLDADEMPKEGSKASAYVEAINNSKSRLIKLQLEKAEAILERFLKVKSHIAEYEAVLSPFKTKAADVLHEISKENIDDRISEIEAPEFFLEALDIENINSPEGFRVLEEINKYYPMQVQWGLAGGQYFVDESVDTEEAFVSGKEKVREKVSVEDAKVEDSSEKESDSENKILEDVVEDSHTTEKVAKIVEDSTDSSDELNVEKKQETKEVADEDVQLGILTATNRVKNSSPSASSFKKEIIKLAKNNKEVKAILPLMTNLGVLNREQIYIVGICMDVFEESDRDREKVEAAIDALVRKGFIAGFEYSKNGTTEEAFCLSSYCNGCLKKDSILVQMKGFWDLSFGDVIIASSGEIEKIAMEKLVRNNKRLAEYLYTAKSIVEPDEYQSIKQSIKWQNDHYQIVVMKDGETTNCSLYDPEDVSDAIEESGILIVGEDEVDDSIKDGSKKVFICHKQSICLVGDLSVFLEDEDDSLEVSNEAELKSIEKADINNDNSEVEEEDKTESISVKSLRNKNTVPTDEEFCTVIEQLLNREVKTKEQLTALISQVVLFSKAVGDVSEKENGVPIDYLESYKLSAQIRLASNLMLNECIYTSEFLSSVFVA